MPEASKTIGERKDAEFLMAAIRNGTPRFKEISFVDKMDLSGQSLKYISFTRCEMPRANIKGADVCFTRFSEMDLTTFRGLGKAKNLGQVVFNMVVVTKRQRKMIENAKADAKEKIPPKSFISVLRKDKQVEKRLRT
jgi:uncharacterized protein YjbI with pentapeptide repeats